MDGLRASALWVAVVLAGCAPAKPAETVIAIGGPSETAPVVDTTPGCPEGTHAEPDKGCVKDAPPLAVAGEGPVVVDLDSDPPQGGAYVQEKDLPARSLETLRDPRMRRPPRSRGILVVELQALERLFVATPAGSPDRPRLIRRIADGFAELAAAAVREKADHLAVPARRSAIRYYTMLHDGYPKHCLSVNSQDLARSTGCGDEVLYFMARHFEELGELDKARKAYLTVVQQWPQSRYVPLTYLAFGELFFTEARSDPSKWPFVEQVYKEVLKYPPPENEVFGYALLRLGETFQKQGDLGKARALFQKLRQFAVQYRDLPAATLPASLIPAGIP